MVCAVLCVVHSVVIAHCHMACLSCVVKAGGNKRLRAQRRAELAETWRHRLPLAEKKQYPALVVYLVVISLIKIMKDVCVCVSGKQK